MSYLDLEAVERFINAVEKTFSMPLESDVNEDYINKCDFVMMEQSTGNMGGYPLGFMDLSYRDIIAVYLCLSEARKIQENY